MHVKGQDMHVIFTQEGTQSQLGPKENQISLFFEKLSSGKKMFPLTLLGFLAGSVNLTDENRLGGESI